MASAVVCAVACYFSSTPPLSTFVALSVLLVFGFHLESLDLYRVFLRYRRQGLGEMRATSSAWAVVLLLAALVPVSLASASVNAGTDVVGGRVRPHRVDDGCAGADDIAIYQGRGTTLPSGVPAYTVDVMNRCSAGDCAIAGIHVRCGWFSSVTLVDPRKFRRLARDDCLINDGQPLLAGETLSFEYANSFPYPLAVAVATCVDPAAATSP
ncbi:hypothetical protein ACQ4PT_054776 [Festuca glaucescens]